MNRLAIFLLVCSTGFAACSAPDTVDPLYYVLFPALAGAQDRPTQPSNLRGSYNRSILQIELNWDASPANGILLYRVYVFTDRPPIAQDELYRDRDRLTESGQNFISFTQSPFTGSLYFLVTAYNGFSESLPSNVVSVDVFNGNF